MSQSTLKILRYQGFSFQKVFKISQHPVTFGWFCVHVSQENGYNLVIFLLGKNFCTVSGTKFNEEFRCTIRFYHSLLLCWENVQKQNVTVVKFWKLSENLILDISIFLKSIEKRKGCFLIVRSPAFQNTPNFPYGCILKGLKHQKPSGKC